MDPIILPPELLDTLRARNQLAELHQATIRAIRESMEAAILRATGVDVSAGTFNLDLQRGLLTRIPDAETPPAQ